MRLKGGLPALLKRSADHSASTCAPRPVGGRLRWHRLAQSRPSSPIGQLQASSLKSIDTLLGGVRRFASI